VQLADVWFAPAEVRAFRTTLDRTRCEQL